MTGGSSGLKDWHRQKRKRELLKNKEQRLAARDEKVKETKSVVSVKEEIRNLERRYKNKETRPHNIQSKLDRLNKELKIVQAEEDAKKKQQQQTTQPHADAKAVTWKPLENPALSIYYDPILNPYGEPPPGKPRLFHTRWGGQTMDIREAGIPGQPPPPPPQNQDSEARPQDHLQGDSGRQQQQQQHRHHQKEEYHRGHSKEEEEDNENLEQGESKRPAQKQQQKPASTRKRAPAQGPVLAVQRPKRYGNQTVDIWASDEDEMKDYGDGEDGTVRTESPHAKQNTVPKSVISDVTNGQWYYRDQAGQIQGPFSTAHMQSWIRAGFFPGTQLVRSSVTDSWNALHDTLVLQDCLPTSSKQHQTVVAANDCKAEGAQRFLGSANALKPSASVQDRIAALRSAHFEERAKDTPTATEAKGLSSSVQDRIAALKQAHQNQSATKECSNDVDKEETKTFAVDDSVQARIAALRRDHQRDMPDDKEQPLAKNQSTVQTGPEATTDVPYPVDMVNVADPVADADMVAIPYPVEEVSNMADIAYPVYEEQYGDAAAGYPQPPPLDGEELDGLYPVLDSYPVLGTYPDDTGYNEVDKEQKPTKKAKVDKEVLSLMPSHLLRRKNG